MGQGTRSVEQKDAMITDEERREIAARLRHRRKQMDNERPPQGCLFAAAVYLLEISRERSCREL